MHTSKLIAGAILVVLLACGGVGSPGAQDIEPASQAIAPSQGSDLPFHGRAGQSGVALQDGRVLFAGGSDSPAAAETYNPNGSGWVAVVPLAHARAGHATVRLRDGRVLIVGGEEPGQADPDLDPVGMNSAEVFDPSTDTFTDVASSLSGFLAPKAALLPSGRVLVVNCEVGEVRAELYDPAQDAWSETSAPARCAQDDDLVAIEGGALLGSGGTAYELERFDAQTKTWRKTAPAPRQRTNRLAVLSDGRVLATGRLSAAADEPDAAVLDPRTGTWSPTPKIPREYEAIDHPHFALVAAGDRVWRVGGSSGRPPTAQAQVEIWSASANAWTAGAPLREARAHPAATALPNGTVLVVGGRGGSGGPALRSFEVLGR